jgi:cyclic pyranopterin phosphate synthase
LKLTHLDNQGRASMVDISHKPVQLRTAAAEGRLAVSSETIDLVRDSALPKGAPLEAARLAGIQAAKSTSRLIPLCHDLNLDHIDVDIRLEKAAFAIRSKVTCRRATGVEMEALTAVAVAALTLYDMCKAVDSGMSIEAVRLVSKKKEDLP